MNFYSKFKLFSNYKRTIRKNKVELLAKFGIKMDFAGRLYTVINIPDNLFEEPYDTKKSDIDSISQSYLKEYIKRLSDYLNSKGLSEIYDFYEPISKVGKHSYLIIIGFKLFDSVKFNNFIYYRLIPFIGIVSLIAYLIYKF